MNEPTDKEVVLPKKAQKLKDAGFSIWYLFKMLYRYSEGSRGRLILAWSMLAIAGLIELTLHPFIITRVLSIVESEGITVENLPKLLWLVFATVLTVIVFWALHGPARVLECDNAFRARNNYRSFMLSGILGLRLDWHASNHSGDTIDKMAKGTSAVYEFGASSFEVVYSLIKLTGSFCLILYFFPKAAIVVFVIFLITCWMIFQFDKVLMVRYRKLNNKENKVAEAVHDATTNVGTIIILRVEKLVFETIMRKSWEMHELDTSNNRLNEVKWFVTNLICQIMIFVVLGWYLVSHLGALKGTILASTYLLYQYLEKIASLCQSLTGMFSFYVSRQARLVDCELISDCFVGESFTDHVLPEDWKQLAIKGLSFAYSGKTDELQLKDVSLVLDRGKRYAFVGESGCGKTTLLKLMRGLHDPTSLDLEVDGVKIKDGFPGIERAIALAPQIPEIFSTTVLGNITIGAVHSMDEVLRYANMAAFTEVAQKLPNGFNSSIKEKGVNLSGGQQQRLALARALLECVGKDIILLDEPTSSLDSLTERRVYENILAGFTEATIVSSIHRLHLLGMFDQIVVFDKGQIVDVGTLDVLLTRCGIFQSMWQQYNATLKESEGGEPCSD